MQVLGTVICPVLVGRDDLLALADRRLSAGARGRGGLLFLAGEAGIGKTRLLGAIERRAATDGFTVARAAAFPRDLEVAGGVFLDLGRSLGRIGRLADAGAALDLRLAPLDPGATPSEDGDAHRRRRILVLDVADTLAELTAGGPVLLSLEDLHWADDLTLEILAAVARHAPELPLVVVGTYRSDELYPRIPMREWRSRLLAARLAEEARINRLDRAGTAAMTTLILGTGLPAPDDLVASIYHRSDGIPLHVEELLAVSRFVEELDATDRSTASAERRTQRAGPAPVPAADVVPETLDEAILRRAERLSPRALRAAEAGAVIGRSFDFDLLAAVMARPIDQLSAPITELERAFFVQPTTEGGQLDFRHALIRDALYAHVPVPTRRRLHGRVADATAGNPRFSPAFRSVHLEQAGRPGEAFETALEGGHRAAAVSAHREALELLQRALRNASADLAPGARAALMVALGDEAAATDANALADRSFEAAAAVYASAGMTREAAAIAPRHVAVRHLLGDDFQARTRRLSAAVESLEGLPDDDATRTVRAQLLAGLSAANMLDRRLEPAIAFGEAARGLAIQTAHTGTERDVAATVGSCLVFAGRMDEGWTLLERAVTEAREGGEEAAAARAYRMIGSSASVLVEYDRAERWLREGIEYAERVELWNHRHYMAAHLGHVGWATGDWDGGERLAAHALSDGRGGITTRITALHALGYVALGRGDFERAETILEEARELGEQMSELQRLSPALWGLAEAALLAGDPAGAIAWCERGEAASAQVTDAAYLYPFLVTGTRAQLASGDPAAAHAWIDRVANVVAGRAIPGTLPAVDHARGLLALARGSTGQARTALEAACAGWATRRRTWEGAWAKLDLATVHARANRQAESRRLAESVAETAATLGSSPLAAAAEQLRRRVRARAAVDPAWAPLTARELEVARLIADGHTNADIAAELGMAHRTATSHVEHILAKLGATRRTEVATWVTRTAASVGPVSGHRSPQLTLDDRRP